MLALRRVLRRVLEADPHPPLGRWCRPDTNQMCDQYKKGEQADYDNGMHSKMPVAKSPQEPAHVRTHHTRVSNTFDRFARL